jgi:hypothetical protein
VFRTLSSFKRTRWSVAKRVERAMKINLSTYDPVKGVLSNL